MFDSMTNVFPEPCEGGTGSGSGGSGKSDKDGPRPKDPQVS
jgi:hypothetical protein